LISVGFLDNFVSIVVFQERGYGMMAEDKFSVSRESLEADSDPETKAHAFLHSSGPSPLQVSGLRGRNPQEGGLSYF